MVYQEMGEPQWQQTKKNLTFAFVSWITMIMTEIAVRNSRSNQELALLLFFLNDGNSWVELLCQTKKPCLAVALTKSFQCYTFIESKTKLKRNGTGGRDITKIYEENIPFKMPMVPSKDSSIAMNRCFEQCNL